MDIDTLKAHRSGPTDTAYIATDGRLRAYDDLPTRYTPAALLHRVNHHSRQPGRWDAVAYAVHLLDQVKQTVAAGTITRQQARTYAATMGLPRPVWPGDHADPKVQDALDQLAEEAAQA